MLRVGIFRRCRDAFSYARAGRPELCEDRSAYGLVADDRIVIDSFKRAFAAAPGLAFGPGHDPADLRRMEREWWNRLVRATFAKVGVLGDFDAYFDALFAFFADPQNWVCDPDAPVLLGALSESGLELGVISNFDHRIYAILDALGLSRHFDSITISSEAGYAKPAPEIFRIALERHELPAQHALHVGDSEALDIAGARAGGHCRGTDRPCGCGRGRRG